MNLIFWLFLVLVLAAVASPFVLIFVIGLRRHSRWLMWLGAIPGGLFLGLACLSLFVLVMSIVHPYSETTNGATIRESFVYNFNFQPGADFVPMNQKIIGVNDTGAMYLQFKVSPATLDRLSTNNLKPDSGYNFISYTSSRYAPTWWPRAGQLSGSFYIGDPWKGPFHGNRAYLFYQPESNLVYFCSVGSD